MNPVERRSISLDVVDAIFDSIDFKDSDEESIEFKDSEEETKIQADIAEFNSLSFDPKQYLNQYNTILRRFNDLQNPGIGIETTAITTVNRALEDNQKEIARKDNLLKLYKTALEEVEGRIKKLTSKKPIRDRINSIVKSLSETLQFLFQDTSILSGLWSKNYKPLFNTELEQLPSEIQWMNNRMSAHKRHIVSIKDSIGRVRHWIAFSEQFTKNDGCLQIISGLFQNSRVIHLDIDLIGMFGTLSEKVEQIKIDYKEYCFVVHTKGRNFYFFTPTNDYTKRMVIYKSTEEDCRRLCVATEDKPNTHSPRMFTTNYYNLNIMNQVGQIIGEYCGLGGSKLEGFQQYLISGYMFQFYRPLTNEAREPAKNFSQIVQAIQYCKRQDKIRDLVAGFLGNTYVSKMVTDYAWSSVQDPETLNLLYADEMVSTLNHYLGRNLKNLVLTYLQEQEPNTSTTTTATSSSSKTALNHITSTAV